MAGLMSVKALKAFPFVRARPTPLVSQAPHHQQESLHADDKIDSFGLPPPSGKMQDFLPWLCVDR
jgi:hypothetical protein